jgi:hypothetical protein
MCCFKRRRVEAPRSTRWSVGHSPGTSFPFSFLLFFILFFLFAFSKSVLKKSKHYSKPGNFSKSELF